MEEINWNERALRSEVAISVAHGGMCVQYGSFIHIHNPIVTWCGDYNRALDVKLTDFKSFEKVDSEIRRIHLGKGLDPPDRYDISPPPLNKELWSGFLSQKSYKLKQAIFFCCPTSKGTLPVGINLYSPSEDQYLEWFKECAKKNGYYSDEYFEIIKPLELGFIKVFKPRWLFKGKILVGYVFCAQLENYSRLFSVEIKEEFRGQGLGRTLLNVVKVEAYEQGLEHILLEASKDMRVFYEKLGFQECSQSSIIWMK